MADPTILNTPGSGNTDPNPTPVVTGGGTVPQPITPPTLDSGLSDEASARYQQLTKPTPVQLQPSSPPQQNAASPTAVKGSLDSLLTPEAQARYDRLSNPSNGLAPGAFSDESLSQHLLEGFAQGVAVVGDTMAAFGLPTAQALKSGDLGLSKETMKSMQDSGFTADSKKLITNPFQSFTAELLVPALNKIVEANTLLSSVIEGGLSAVSTAATDLGQPKLGSGLAGMGEWYATTMGADFPMHFPEAFNTSIAEGGVPRSGPLTDSQVAARDNFIGGLPKTGLNAPDIHAEAFRVAPEVMNEYNTLLDHQDVIREGVKTEQAKLLDTPEAKEVQGKIDDILDSVNGNEEELSDRKADQLSKARDALDEIKSQVTPEIQDLKDTAKKIQDRMAEVEPDVKTAYQTASDNLNGGSVEAPDGKKAGPAPTDAKKGEIAQDVSQKLQDAGRSKTEADVAGAVVESHYNSIAARGEGKFGTAKEVYDQNFPDVLRSANTKDVVNTLNQAGLRVARKMPDGSVKIGEPGQLHFDLYDDPKEYDKAAPSNDGFATKDGKFLSRFDAASWVSDNEPDIYRKFIKQGKDWKDSASLESVKYDRASGLKSGPETIGFIKKLINTLFQEKRGSITLMKGARNIIRLFKDADASTFFHEMGHQFLEELMKYARHPDAPKELLSDARAVRDFLGGKEGEGITRAQHERFARTFERYLREGIAPSKELAGIFQKLKEWLSQLYQKVSQLKAPINDEIRGVFDRLIVNNPDERSSDIAARGGYRTVIAPAEKGVFERGGTGELFQKKKGSKDSVKKSLSGDLDDSRGETSKSATPPTEPASKTVWPKGHDPNDLPDRPGARFVTVDGDYNLENVNSHESVMDAVREFAEAHSQELASRRGNMTNQDIIDFNESLGIVGKRASLNGLKQLSAENNIPVSVMTYAAGKMVVKSLQDVMTLARSGSSELEFVIARQRFLKLAPTFLDARADWGVSGHALRLVAKEAEDIEGLTAFFEKTIGKTLDQVRLEMKEGKHLDTAGKMAKALQKWGNPTWGNFALEAFRNSLISGPITHTGYFAGNYLKTVYNILLRTPGEAAVGTFQRAFSNTPIESAHFGEVVDGTYALMSGTLDALKAGKDSLLSGTTQALRLDDLARVKAKSEGLSGKGLDARVKELVANPTPAMKAKAEHPQAVFSKTASIPGVAGHILRWPGERMVGPLHSMTYVLNYTVEESRLISQRAHYEADMAGKNSLYDVSANMAKLKADTPLDIVKQAKEFAAKSSLISKTGPFTGNFINLVNTPIPIPGSIAGTPIGPVPLLRFAAPFVSVPALITKAALVDEGPLGLLSKRLWEDALGKNGPGAQARSIAGVTVGSAFMYAIAGLYHNGLMTGPPPSDPDEAVVDQMVNGLPYSAQIGEMSYEYRRLGIPGAQAAFATQLAAAYKAKDTEGYQKATLDFVLNFSRQFAEEGVGSLSELFQAISNPKEYGANYVDRFLVSAVELDSVALGQIAKRIDPYQRESHGFLQELEANTPFLSEELMPKVDLFGNPVPNNHVAVITYSRQVTSDPVWLALQGSKYFPKPVKRDISGVKLTDEQYYEYATQAGTLAKQVLDGIVADPGFKDLPVAARHDMIKSVIEQSRANAALLVQANPKNSDISEQIIKNKVNLSGTQDNQ